MIYLVHAKYWDEFEDATVDNRLLVAAANYQDAADKVVKYVGEDNIESIKLRLIGEDIMVVPYNFNVSELADAQIW